MDIRCLFYSEFDINTGPVLTSQIPDNFIESEAFKVLQTFVIPDKDLCGKLCVLTLKPNLCLLGLPVAIVNPKYPRGNLEFNFGLVVPQSTLAKLNHRLLLERTLRKMAYYLTMLELEDEMLSG